MTRWTGPVLVLLGMSIAGCRGQSPAAGGSETEVRKVVDRYLAALTAQPVNVDSLETFFHPDAEVLEPGVVAFRGANRVRLFLESFADVTVEKVEFQVDTVEVHPSTAYVWGFLSQAWRHGDSARTSRGRAVWVLQQDSTAHWRIRRTMTQPVSE